jgi:glycerol uptake facilitator protein
MQERWLGKYIGEAIGVYLIVLFGCGLLFSAILFGVIGDFYSAGMGWGLTVGIAVYAGASMSGAHFNPAVTLGLAATGRFPWRHVPQYWVSQIIGGVLGAATLVVLFWPALTQFATKNSLVVGQAGSEKLAAMLIPVSPHPWVIGIDQTAYDTVPVYVGFIAEMLCTAILMAFILALLERRSVNGPVGWFFPVALGLLVCMIVIIDGPLTMTSLNPARDLGPRIVALLMGFGSVAFPGVRDGWSLVITVGAPLVGGVVGALFFDYVMKPFFPPTAEEPKPAPAAQVAASTAPAALK